MSIAFDVALGDRQLHCGEGLPALTDLRFFVHDVELVTADGRQVPVELEVVAGWQSADVALVDLEDGSGRCLNGTPATRRIVTGSVEPGSYTGLRFVLGVPAALNHGDPLLAEPPLTATAMHWHWRSGYKFLRAGFSDRDGNAWLHLGSARCHGFIGRLEGCDAANLAQVAIDDFDAGTGTARLDLERLFAGASASDGQAASCQMAPDEPLCAHVLEALGLDPASGASRGPAPSFVAGGTQ